MDFFNYPQDYQKIINKVQLKPLTSLSFQKRVIQVINKVRKEGDKALREYSSQFDKVQLKNLKIDYKERKVNLKNQTLKKSLEVAITNIQKFHEKQKLEDIHYQGEKGEILKQTITPIEKVGVYVPGGIGGKTPLVSTLLMNVIPAQIAGVKEINVCTPPQSDGSLNPVLLYAAKLLKIKNIFKVGGAQAIAALAYGTESIPRSDIIVGPGNEYVTYAKKMVYGDVAIDGLAGNSEIVILSDGSEKPSYLAADLLSQAEHSGNELVVFVTNQKKHALEVREEVNKQLENAPRKKAITSSLQKRGAIVVFKSWQKIYSLINEIAPEHLALNLKSYDDALKKIKNAGTIFVGKYASEPIGDYICGTNHVLPTNQTARFASPLGVYTFLKRTNFINYNQKAFSTYSPSAISLAESEGLFAHANALKIRK